ncbi:Hypothetical predicted protein [Pelobates cultripes]|uniref:Uncharacterized protein n=1 Tax=Pelobates cultripes TaxID=61616 RepID=A0AAD1R6L4_PELCU|nr:Hypothetical predicted protein [Pelobates cultripes]
MAVCWSQITVDKAVQKVTVEDRVDSNSYDEEDDYGTSKGNSCTSRPITRPHDTPGSSSSGVDAGVHISIGIPETVMEILLQSYPGFTKLDMLLSVGVTPRSGLEKFCVITL